MKLFLIILLLSFAVNGFGAETKPKTEKIYTEEEFQNKLSSELNRILKKINKDDLTGFAKELMEKESEIKATELSQQSNSQQLVTSQKEFEKKVQEFQVKQKTFLSCLDATDQKENKRIEHLVAVISGMKPQSAADVLSVQEPEIAVQVLGLLDPVKVSKIFNLMDKEISARLQKQYLNMKR